jgi:hypothetical protein
VDIHATDDDASKITITVTNPHYVEDEDGGRTEYDVTVRFFFFYLLLSFASER